MSVHIRGSGGGDNRYYGREPIGAPYVHTSGNVSEDGGNVESKTGAGVGCDFGGRAS